VLVAGSDVIAVGDCAARAVGVATGRRFHGFGRGRCEWARGGCKCLFSSKLSYREWLSCWYVPVDCRGGCVYSRRFVRGDGVVFGSFWSDACGMMA
jgi:hypothetical protein